MKAFTLVVMAVLLMSPSFALGMVKQNKIPKIGAIITIDGLAFKVIQIPSPTKLSQKQMQERISLFQSMLSDEQAFNAQYQNTFIRNKVNLK